jgi:hypothetical protein
MHVSRSVKSKKNSPSVIPDWIHELISQDTDDPGFYTPPQCFMKVYIDPLASGNILDARSRNGFYKLDIAQKLSALLRNRQFVEFPTIEIWDTDAFQGSIVDEQGSVVPKLEERQPKRRKLDKRAGKKAIAELLGGYGSEEDRVKEEDTINVLDMLGGYTESEDDELGDEDAEGETDEEANVEYDPAALIELMKQVQGGVAVDEDEVDWGSDEQD